METNSIPHESESRQIPAVLLLAEESKPVEVVGNFDVEQQTWSNRHFEDSSIKKHNEAM